MLIAIDPDSTSDVEIAGAVFTLGTVPAAVWQRVKFRQILAYEQAERRVTNQMRKDGIPPDDIISSPTGGATVSRRGFMVQTDPTFRADLASIAKDLIRHGVRGHSGIQLPDGKTAVFETTTDTLEGETVTVVSPATLRLYMTNFWLAEKIFAALIQRCELGESAKKV